MKELSIQFQVNSAISVCEGRIGNGMDENAAFEALQQEIDAIFNGEIIYED